MHTGVQMKLQYSVYLKDFVHRDKWEPKLWVLFDRARKQEPQDYMLAFAILCEIDRLIKADEGIED